MLPVSEHRQRGRRRVRRRTRGRWLFAIVMFAIGIVPVTEIARAVGPANVPACPGATYSVVSGDSWSRIASRASRSRMTALMNANKATTATVIHPGQTLCLPANAAPPAPTTPRPRWHRTPPATPRTQQRGVSISVFPAQGPCSYADTYGAPRSGGRIHEGVDIIAKAGQWVYAVKDGTLTKKYFDAHRLAVRKRLAIDSRRRHATSSTPTSVRSPPGLSVGSPVKAGQIIGQIGMTGDAPIPHLHFEVHPGWWRLRQPDAERSRRSMDARPRRSRRSPTASRCPPTTVPPTRFRPPRARHRRCHPSTAPGSDDHGPGLRARSAPPARRRPGSTRNPSCARP